MAQKLCFPLKYCNITQGTLGKYSHSTGSAANKYALDIAGKDSGADPVFAQGDGAVVDIGDAFVEVKYEDVISSSNTVYEYVICRYYHNTANNNIKVGQRLARGQAFMKEGKKGNASGNHIHVSIRGKAKGGKEIQLYPEKMFTVDAAYNKYIRYANGEDWVRIF